MWIFIIGRFGRHESVKKEKNFRPELEIEEDFIDKAGQPNASNDRALQNCFVVCLASSMDCCVEPWRLPNIQSIHRV